MQQEPACYLLDPCEVRRADRLFGMRPDTPLNDEVDGTAELSSGLSYELRTSLTIITLLCGNLDRLYERLEDEDRRRMIQKMRTQMQRLNELVSDMLALRENAGSVSV